MVRVTVRIVKRKGLSLAKELTFLFHTQPEASAFTSGLRVIDSLKKTECMFDALVEPTDESKQG